MTEAEYSTKQAELLEQVPPEFWGAFGYMAWQRGHSSGHQEVLMILEDMIYELKDSIKNFEERVRRESIPRASA